MEQRAAGIYGEIRAATTIGQIIAAYYNTYVCGNVCTHDRAVFAAATAAWKRTGPRGEERVHTRASAEREREFRHSSRKESWNSSERERERESRDSLKRGKYIGAYIHTYV